MGSFFSQGPTTKERSIATTNKGDKYKDGLLRQRHADLGELGATDFYDLFGLKRHCKITEENKRRIESAYRKLCREYHPDRLPNRKEYAEAMMGKLTLAKETLLKPDHKRRYDIELGGNRGGWEWYARWGCSVVSGLGGLAMVVVGIVAVPVTGGASIGLSIGGSALMSAGIKSGMKQYKDPNCSTTEFVKDYSVGLGAGAAGGAIGVGAGVAMAGAGAAACIGHAAWSGAAAVIASNVIDDTTNLAITNISMLEGVKDNCSDLKSNDYIFKLFLKF